MREEGIFLVTTIPGCERNIKQFFFPVCVKSIVSLPSTVKVGEIYGFIQFVDGFWLSALDKTNYATDFHLSKLYVGVLRCFTNTQQLCEGLETWSHFSQKFN